MTPILQALIAWSFIGIALSSLFIWLMWGK